jgi:hypothetical protein
VLTGQRYRLELCRGYLSPVERHVCGDDYLRGGRGNLGVRLSSQVGRARVGFPASTSLRSLLPSSIPTHLHALISLVMGFFADNPEPKEAPPQKVQWSEDRLDQYTFE